MILALQQSNKEACLGRAELARLRRIVRLRAAKLSLQDRPRVRSHQISTRIRRIIAADTFFIRIHLEEVLRAIWIMLGYPRQSAGAASSMVPKTAVNDLKFQDFRFQRGAERHGRDRSGQSARAPMSW